MYTLRAITSLLCSIFLLTISQAHDIESSKISDQELREFGTQLENSLNSQNPYYFNLSFDTDRLLTNVFSEYGHSPDPSFHQGFVDGIKNNLDLGSLLVNELVSGGSIELVSVRSEADRSSLIFRLVGANGINYHEYFVESEGENLKLTDVYIYSTGQRISESIGELYISSWYNIETDYTQSLEKINTLKQEGKFRKAYHKWNQLPEQAKREKSNLLLGMDISAKLDPNSFYQVYNLFSLYYPEEPGKYLIPLDGLIASGLYETALQNIDSLDRSVQHDPILDFVRANIYYEAKKTGNAEACLYKLIEQMPDYELAYFSLLDIYLKETNYAKATNLLNQMVSIFHNYKEDYTVLFADYPEFVDSPEYQAWLEQ